MRQFNKIFGIGLSKTGTKSLNLACKQLGFNTKHWNFEWDELETLDGVMDTPVAQRFRWLDRVYPDSKFILTVRSLEPWLDSCRRHFATPAEPGSRQRQIREVMYECQVYNERKFIHAYARHSAAVARHFEQDKDRLLLLDICDGDGWEKLCPFLDVQIPDAPFPRAAEVRDIKAQKYWDQRYTAGKGSGKGSQGKEATFKAYAVNAFMDDHQVRDVIEFGFGDGEQLDRIDYPQYTGFDISSVAVDMCRKRFEVDMSKTFKLLEDYNQEQADVAISLDVLYHLVDRITFDDYMHRLFSAATRYVIIYSTNHTNNKPTQARHVRHRQFTNWVERERPDWKLYPWTFEGCKYAERLFVYKLTN